MYIWMLEQNAANLIREMRALKMVPSAEQMAAFNTDRSREGFSIMRIEDKVAKIPITGVLTNKPDIFARLFGGGNTAYSDIIDAVAKAEASPDVESIEYEVSSPGGMVSGMFDAMDIIAAAEKPSKAIVTGVAASAAYGLASQADKIVAANDTTQLGSIGVAQTITVWQSDIDLRSDNAPKKNPDVTTKAGKKAATELLNDLAAKLSERIAEGRSKATSEKLTASIVNSEFGQGGVFLADKALKAGMIDDIIQKPALALVSDNEPKPTTAISGKANEETVMDLNTLKTQHTALYDQIVQEARQAGIEEERERVSAHLIFAENSGSVEFAHACIKDGKSTADQTVVATYMTATKNKADQGNRQDDNTNLGGTNTDGQEGNLSDDDKMVAMVEQLTGVEAGA